MPNPSFLCSPKSITTASIRFAHPLNLMNAAVSTSEINQSQIRVVAVKIQRSRFGCSQNVERW